MDIKLFDSELKVMDVIWREGDTPAKEIARQLTNELGWNVNTTYTLIKRCMKKGAIERSEPGFLCHALIPKSAVQEAETVIEEPVELLPEVISPLDGTTVTVFSMTELLYDQTMADWRTHNGIDVQAEEGAAVKTAADGTVLSVTSDELMGTTVVIQHSGGYTTQYSSLQSDVPVAEGQSVRAGDIIGRVGSTSAAESEMGPHLHFSVSQDGSVIDPHAYIED